MTKKVTFKKIARVDNTKAGQGMKTEVYDENGGYYGTFKLRFWDMHNKPFKVELDRWEREWENTKGVNRKLKGIHAFVNAVLLDWSEVKDSEDKDVPFSKEVAFDLLSDNDGDNWLVEELFRRSKDARYFAPALEESKEEILGN